MKHIFRQPEGGGQLRLLTDIEQHDRNYFQRKEQPNFLTIAWNMGNEQTVRIDEINYNFGANTVLPIMHNQSFWFENPKDVLMWQFNREFYCIVNHDAEVGCVGFLFYGPSPTMFVSLDDEYQQRMQRLLELFHEEFNEEEDIKGEMLRMLLVRLIIKITRLAKKQYLATEVLVEEKFNVIRQYSLMVEVHYRKEHQVQFYAGLLHKSPKTISNIFSLYSKRTPLQVIQDRIVSEAKRLLYYTDKSVKEIADDLGFEDASHFSKYFKKCTSINPSELKKS